MSRLKNTIRLGAIAAVIAFGSIAQAEPARDIAGKSPWGSKDEIGTLNMMTDESRLQALQQIASGKVYDLAVNMFVGMPDCCSATFGDPGYQNWMTHAPARGVDGHLLSHSGDAISMSTHTGTHIDTLSHFGLNGKIWNGVDAAEALSVRGWKKSGAEKYPPIVSRGVMIDVAAYRDEKHLPASYAITSDDLKGALRQQGTELRPGDVVLVRTGLMTLWPDRSKLQLFTQPGLSLDAAQWLAEEKQVMLLGADNFGLESFPSKRSDNFAPVHSYLLAEKGISFIEVMWLEDLSKDKVYEFVFITAPLKLTGATGSPVRPLAIPIRNEQ